MCNDVRRSGELLHQRATMEGLTHGVIDRISVKYRSFRFPEGKLKARQE